MRKIYEKNYKNYPANFREVLMIAFDKRTDPMGGGAVFDLLKYKDEVVGFLSFEKIGQFEDGRKKKYFGSFNISLSYNNAKLGEAMLKKALNREAQASIIVADCDPIAPITQKYIENGFVATKYYNYEGVPSFKIIRDDELNNKLESKKISQSEIIKMANGNQLNPNIIVKKYLPEEGFDFSILENGAVLTQYKTDKKTGITYGIFEKKKYQENDN